MLPESQLQGAAHSQDAFSCWRFGNRNGKAAATTGLLSQDSESGQPTPELRLPTPSPPRPSFRVFTASLPPGFVSIFPARIYLHLTSPLTRSSSQPKSRCCLQNTPLLKWPVLQGHGRLKRDRGGMSYRKKAERNLRKLGCLGTLGLFPVQLPTGPLAPPPKAGARSQQPSLRALWGHLTKR